MNTTALLAQYESCMLCPHACKVNRRSGQRGICGESDELRIAFAGIHRGEEPPISPAGPFRGSGTVFFSGCTLGCSFCQNREISKEGLGSVVSPEIFAAICMELQSHGAANINLVTGTHFIPGIRLGLDLAREKGLAIPVVWNTSSFESKEGLDLILPSVGIFLADLKIMSEKEEYRGRGGSLYWDAAIRAVERMASVRSLRFGDCGEMLEGVIIRHLVMPGNVESSERVFSWFRESIGVRAVLSVMNQYVDTSGAGLQGNAKEEYLIMELLDAYGIEEGFIQESGDETAWIPRFRDRNPFPESFSDPIWHYREGFLV